MPLEDILNVAESFGLDREELGRKIQERYAVCVKERRFDELRRLQEITGIKPELSENVVQEAYATCVKEERFDELRSLQEITGIKPSEEIYRAFISYLLK